MLADNESNESDRIMPTREELEQLTFPKFLELYEYYRNRFVKKHYTIAVNAVNLLFSRVVLEVAKSTGYRFKRKYIDYLEFESVPESLDPGYIMQEKISLKIIPGLEALGWKYNPNDTKKGVYKLNKKSYSIPGPQTAHGEKSGFRGRLQCGLYISEEYIKIYTSTKRNWDYVVSLDELAKEICPTAQVRGDYQMNMVTLISMENGLNRPALSWFYYVAQGVFEGDTNTKRFLINEKRDTHTDSLQKELWETLNRIRDSYRVIG